VRPAVDVEDATDDGGRIAEAGRERGAQDCNRRRARPVLVGPEPAPRDKRHAQHIEDRCRRPCAIDALAALRGGQGEAVLAIGAQALERAGALPPVEVVAG
jgi:hypothetical protein